MNDNFGDSLHFWGLPVSILCCLISRGVFFILIREIAQTRKNNDYSESLYCKYKQVNDQGGWGRKYTNIYGFLVIYFGFQSA